MPETDRDNQALSTDPATRYMAAFNEIEQWLRKAMNGKTSDSFSYLAHQAEKQGIVSGKEGNLLEAAGGLRNAIAHGAYRNGEPVADPREDIISDLEKLGARLANPPLAMQVLTGHQVVKFQVNDPITKVLDKLASSSISQFPIYDGNRFTGTLTSDAMAHWVAADMGDNGTIDATTVGDILRHSSSTSADTARTVFVARDVTAQEIVSVLTTPTRKAPPPRIVIVTEHGKPDEGPLRVIGASDLPQLVHSLDLF